MELISKVVRVNHDKKFFPLLSPLLNYEYENARQVVPALDACKKTACYDENENDENDNDNVDSDADIDEE